MNTKKQNTVFLLGAGFNQELFDWDGLNPPLAKNFFQLIGRSPRYEGHFRKNLAKVFKFIEKFWKINEKEVISREIDLEKLLTFIDLKIEELYEKEKFANLEDYIQVQNSLVETFISFLQTFDHQNVRNDIYIKFGRKIFNQKPDIISFNYDLYLEQILQLASGIRMPIPDIFKDAHKMADYNLPEELLKYSHFNYNIPVSYGVKFDIVGLHMAGPTKFEYKDKFYNINELYPNSILKLHGSLNWSKIRMRPIQGKRINELDESLIGKIILSKNYWVSNLDQHFNNWIIKPYIITPTLYKRYDEKLFKEIWKIAKEKLSQCKKLIIIGYSFPPTDFHCEKLFLDSFEDNELEQLIVVNPDTSVAEKVKDLTHFNQPVSKCENLYELIDLI